MTAGARRWLVTGGAGYIGAHVVRAFESAGISTVVLDDLSTGLRARVPVSVPLIQANCADAERVRQALDQYRCIGVVHLAALKHARESSAQPLRYWDNNLGAMLGVLKGLDGTSVAHFVLSSSCSIYGGAGAVDVASPPNPQSPYARTKVVCEQVLGDCAKLLGISWMTLRYFNVIGNDDFSAAHDTSPECLVPATAARLARGEPPVVYGTDFSTPDGTALRDYVDVRDLAAAHLLAAQHLMNGKEGGMTLDVGSGSPISVLEVLSAIHEEFGQPLSFRDGERNAADPDAVWAKATSVGTLLGWMPTHDLASSIRAHVTASGVGRSDGRLS